LNFRVFVQTLFNIKKADLYSGSRKKRISEVRSLFCYWCINVIDLRNSHWKPPFGRFQVRAKIQIIA